MEIEGKRVLISGAGRGLGRTLVAAFVEAGAAEVFAGTRKQEARDALQHEFPERVTPVQLDVTVDEDVEAVSQLGTIDILVNNAGLTRDNILFRLKDDDWDAVLDANLRGAFVAIRAVARGMMKRRWGRIINIASVVGITGNKGQANYAASKAGLIGLTKSVAKELASRNILINAVAPGFIETDMTAAMTDEARKAMGTQIPLERLGTPADIAAMVAFLASEHAAYITGQVLVVDGGLVM
jgi:3-oxoacyl-[acyl-carrier protein] reductase